MHHKFTVCGENAQQIGLSTYLYESSCTSSTETILKEFSENAAIG